MNRQWAPYALSTPAAVVLVVFMAAPLIMVLLLSFNSFTMATGIQPGFTWANYIEVLGDKYFHTIFGRTFLLAAVVTVVAVLIGAPEAYIIHRMRPPWRSIFLLIVLGPLLVSVIVRTLGWAVLLGNRGLVNTTLIRLGL